MPQKARTLKSSEARRPAHSSAGEARGSRRACSCARCHEAPCSPPASPPSSRRSSSATSPGSSRPPAAAPPPPPASPLAPLGVRCCIGVRCCSS
eukprot:scaffold42577_cov57-Phaeocystis_antarctica.AAC.3